MCERKSKIVPGVDPDKEIIQEKRSEESILEGYGDEDFIGLCARGKTETGMLRR